MQTTPDHLIGLMRRVAAKDRAAFRALYAATSAKLYGIALRISKRPDLADEVLQDAFFRVWNNAASFDPARASPITWMAAITRNRALDELRRRQLVALDEAPELHDIADPGMLAIELMEAADDYATLLKCLETLEPERREIVKLAYLDGLSREELGQRFGHPVATIKTWLHRSLKQLKSCLTA